MTGKLGKIHTKWGPALDTIAEHIIFRRENQTKWLLFEPLILPDAGKQSDECGDNALACGLYRFPQSQIDIP